MVARLADNSTKEVAVDTNDTNLPYASLGRTAPFNRIPGQPFPMITSGVIYPVSPTARPVARPTGPTTAAASPGYGNPPAPAIQPLTQRWRRPVAQTPPAQGQPSAAEMQSLLRRREQALAQQHQYLANAYQTPAPPAPAPPAPNSSYESQPAITAGRPGRIRPKGVPRRGQQAPPNTVLPGVTGTGAGRTARSEALRRAAAAPATSQPRPSGLRPVRSGAGGQITNAPARPKRVGGKAIIIVAAIAMLLAPTMKAITSIAESLMDENGPLPQYTEPSPPTGGYLTTAEFLATRTLPAGSYQLDSGSYTIGPDIAPGRYLVTLESDSPGAYGTVKVDPWPDQTVPRTPTFEIGAAFGEDAWLDATMNLPRTGILVIQSDYPITLAPAPEPTLLEGRVPQGEWEVGIDIEPGRYLIEPAGDTFVPVRIQGPVYEEYGSLWQDWDSFYLDTDTPSAEASVELDLDVGFRMQNGGSVILTKL